MFLYKSAQVIFGGTDNTLISVLVGTIWVGIYSNYNIVINAVNGFIDILYRSAIASIGNVIATNSEEKRYEVFRFTQLFSCILTTITTCCLMLLLNDFIRLWVGKEFVLNKFIFLSIIFNYYFNGVIHPIWSFREACGLYMKTKYIMILAAIINIILSVILGIYFGITGILIASLIARLSTYFWYEPKILFNEYFNCSQKHFYYPLLQNTFYTVIVTFVSYTITSMFTVNNWLDFIIKTISVGLLSTIGTLIFYYKNDTFQLFIKKYINNYRK